MTDEPTAEELLTASGEAWIEQIRAMFEELRPHLEAFDAAMRDAFAVTEEPKPPTTGPPKRWPKNPKFH
ncbi:hypothetical protein GCM10027447_12560 [Glycomyces halotolerans]